MLNKNLQSKSVETLQRSWENFTIKSVETLQWNWGKIFQSKGLKTFKILNQILQPKMFDLISCLIRLKNQNQSQF
jgi:hypothetical protein